MIGSGHGRPVRRVLVVIPSLTPEAGAESSMAAVLPLIAARGVDIHLALLTANQGLVPKVQAAGVVVHDLAGASARVQVRRLRALVRRLEPDVVHSTLFQASVPMQFAALGSGVPSLVTWANTPTDPRTELAATWKLRVVEFVEMAIARLPNTRFHAVTEGVAITKARSLRVRRERVAVAERGRDRDVYHPQPISNRAAALDGLGLPTDAQMLLAVGRQESQKGYVDLVGAFDRAAQSHPRAHLVIAGRDGSATADIDRAVAGARAVGRIHRLGHRDDVGHLLQLADAIVCASYREGAAGALIEAMASGTPIVSVELDGMIGVLEDGVNAVVVPRRQLDDGLRRVLANREAAARRADAALKMFEQRFTLERSAEALLGVYGWAASAS